jgi:hypothetical protein
LWIRFRSAFLIPEAIATRSAPRLIDDYPMALRIGSFSFASEQLTSGLDGNIAVSTIWLNFPTAYTMCIASNMEYHQLRRRGKCGDPGRNRTDNI